MRLEIKVEPGHLGDVEFMSLLIHVNEKESFTMRVPAHEYQTIGPEKVMMSIRRMVMATQDWETLMGDVARNHGLVKED